MIKLKQEEKWSKAADVQKKFFQQEVRTQYHSVCSWWLYVEPSRTFQKGISHPVVHLDKLGRVYQVFFSRGLRTVLRSLLGIVHVVDSTGERFIIVVVKASFA